MSTVDISSTSGSSGFEPPIVPKSQPLHRIRTVREEQGLSLRSVARRMKIDTSRARAMENGDADMPLSMLYKWHEALEVPVAHLLVDSDEGLAEPVERRAKLLKVMKTAAAILETAEEEPIQRMAQMLVEQILDIMPEVKGVSPWHAVGQRRTLDECGRIAERTFSDEWFSDSAG